MKKIAIIILHFGDKKVTQKCLASLYDKETYSFDVILVNNTQEHLIGKYFRRRNVVVLNNKENLGFAKGVNIGITFSQKKKYPYYLLLNNDTHITKPLLPSLVQTSMQDKAIGIVGPVIAFKKNKKKIFDLGGIYNRFLGRTSHTEVSFNKGKELLYPNYVSGCCMLIKKEVVEKVGIFDPHFFLYYEDVDFCLRPQQKGFTIAVDPKVVISHALSKSAGKSSPLAVYHQTKSAIIFGRKYMTKWYQKILHTCFLAVQIMLFGKSSFTNLQASLKAVWDEKKDFFKNIFYFFVFFALGLFSFWRIFSFGFWKDDWSLYWSTLYDITQYHGYFNHPETPIEFFLLSRVLGLHFFWWQLLGFTLHIIGAFAIYLFIKTVTKSQKIGILSGIFFAVSYAGLESIYYPSVHVTIVALSPLLFACQQFIHSVTNKKHIKSFLFWFLLALLLDPPRIIPIIFLLPILLVLQKHTKFYNTLFIWLKKFFIGFVIFGIPLFILWFVFLSPGTQLAIGIQQTLKDPSFLIRKMYLWWNLLAAIGNLCIGLVYPMLQDDQNTGVYSRIFAIAGGIVFLFGVSNLVVFLKTKSQKAGYYALFSFWMFLFYLPNWFSEPRAPMAAPHRYLLIPSVGFIGLLAISIAELPWQPLIFAFASLIVFLNMTRANSILSYQSSYRDAGVTLGLWKQIDKQVAQDTEGKIFMFYGKEPWLSQTLILNGAAPLAVIRGNITNYSMPMITTDESAILPFLCKENVPILNRWNIVLQHTRISLSHIYAWKVVDSKSLINISLLKRKEFLHKAQKKNCSPLM